MYDENQIVQVRWNNTNESWYKSKGYLFTKKNDWINIRAKDLTPHSNKKIEAICDYCGKRFETQYATITKGRNVIQKDACQSCAALKAREVSWSRRANKYFNLADEVCKSKGYAMITKIEEFTDVKMYIQFSCPKHGIQKTILDSFIRGHECRACSYETRRESIKLSKSYVHNVVRSKGNEWLNPEEYTNSTDANMLIRCLCGNKFTTSFANFSRANVFRCPICSKKESIGEFKIREFLESHKIEYEQEKRFKDCRDKKPLPFDFYLPAYNMCIEFDGIQHYKENFKFSLGSFQATQRHDEIKNNYYKIREIKLLRIPYWEINKINDILEKEIAL